MEEQPVAAMGETAAEGPIEGCPEWCRYLDGDGDAYFYNTTTEDTQWEMPAEVALVLQAQQKAAAEDAAAEASPEAEAGAEAESPRPADLRGLRTHSWTQDLGVRPEDLAASLDEMTDSELESTLAGQGLREPEEAPAAVGGGPKRSLSVEEELQRTCSLRERLKLLFAEELAPVIESDAENQQSPEKPSPVVRHVPCPTPAAAVTVADAP